MLTHPSNKHLEYTVVMKKNTPVQLLREQYATFTTWTPETVGFGKEFIAGILYGTMQMLGDALHETGQYNGFVYINPKNEIIQSVLDPEFEEYRRRYF